MKNLKTVSWLCALCASLGLSITANAQQQYSYDVGKPIKFSLELDIPTGEMVSSGTLRAWTGTIPPTQQGLTNGFNIGCRPTTQTVFECSTTIPSDIATGDYEIVQVDITLEKPTTVTVSSNKGSFPVRKFHVNNPVVIVPPTIKDLKEVPPSH
jgi:hypothetical protein